MLKIWGRVNSVNVKKVLWAAEELGLKYERIDAGREFGVVNTPEYKKMNPNSLVPTIDDAGFVLWESHAIVRYLAAKHGAGTLWPVDLRQRADSDRWMDWAFTFQASLRAVFWNLVRTPEKRDMQAVDEGRKKCAELLAIPDRALAPALLRRQLRHHRRHPARLPRTDLDAPANRAPGAPEPEPLVRPAVRAGGFQEDRRYPAVVK